MTDRIYAFTVVLDQDIRTDDVEPVINAIRMVRHVIDVTEHVADPAVHAAMMRVRSESYLEIVKAIKKVLGY